MFVCVLICLNEIASFIAAGSFYFRAPPPVLFKIKVQPSCPTLAACLCVDFVIMTIAGS